MTVTSYECQLPLHHWQICWRTLKLLDWPCPVTCVRTETVPVENAQKQSLFEAKVRKTCCCHWNHCPFVTLTVKMSHCKNWWFGPFLVIEKKTKNFCRDHCSLFLKCQQINESLFFPSTQSKSAGRKHLWNHMGTFTADEGRFHCLHPPACCRERVWAGTFSFTWWTWGFFTWKNYYARIAEWEI